MFLLCFYGYFMFLLCFYGFYVFTDFYFFLVIQTKLIMVQCDIEGRSDLLEEHSNIDSIVSEILKDCKNFVDNPASIGLPADFLWWLA